MKCLAIWLASAAVVHAANPKLTPEDRLEIVRGLAAEYATVKAYLPASKKPIPFPAEGYDKAAWEEIGRQFGPAARVGDLVQVTKVDIGKDEILLEINGGLKNGSKWTDHVSIGMGGNSGPIRNSGAPSNGTTIAVQFRGGVPSMDAKDIKKLLAPVLDFEKRSATENYVDSLPAPIQAAIKENRAVEGMNHDQVLLALGKPIRKVRETKDGVDYEDWVYGEGRGKITFVTFTGDKVVKVKEMYAGLGGSTAPPLTPN